MQILVREKNLQRLSIVLPKLKGEKREELKNLLAKLNIRLIEYSKQGKAYKFDDGDK